MAQTKGRVLGIDYGSKRVGVALSDPLQVIAQGVVTLDNDSSLLQRLVELVDDREVVRIVVGMPYSEDGGIGGKALEVERFIESLKERTRVPIDTWDESLSSVDARRLMVEGGYGRKKRRQRGRVDVMAARLVLQGYLDHRSTA